MKNANSSSTTVASLLGKGRDDSSLGKPPPWYSVSRHIRYRKTATTDNGIEMVSTSSTPSTRDTKNPRKWLKGIHIAAGAAFAVLIINIILTVIAVGIAYSKFPGQGISYATLYRGSCTVTSNWVTGLHLVINILSTIVLAASNYSMQCLSAPSREEIDRAHAQRVWLHVGTTSMRNFSFLPTRRRMLWLVLLVTSLPFHNLYNSTVFSSKPINKFEYAVATADSDLNALSIADDSGCFEKATGQTQSDFLAALANGSVEHLDTEKCLEAIRPAEYNDIAVCENCASDQGLIVFLATDLRGVNSSVLYSVHTDDWSGESGIYSGEASLNIQALPWGIPSYEMTIPRPNDTVMYSIGNTSTLSDLVSFSDSHGSHSYQDLETLQEYFYGIKSLQEATNASLAVEFLHNASNWWNSSWAASVKTSPASVCANDIYPTFPSSAPYHFNGCLSQRLPARCELHFSLSFCVLIIACNIIKIFCMRLATQDQRKDLLLTIGDAIASFLDDPDSTTKARCLTSISTIGQWPHRWRAPPLFFRTKPSSAPVPLAGADLPDSLPQRSRWFRAAGSGQWTMPFCFLCISTPILFLLYLILSTDKDGSGTTSFFGTNIQSVAAEMGDGIKRDYSPLLMMFLANTPQLGLSIIYFLYNNLLTHMLLAAEYTSYSRERKPLRVSFPRGSQRSTYFLTVPYRYGVPLLIGSAALHWLVSEAFFYTRLVYYGNSGTGPQETVYSMCSLSLIPTLIVAALGGVMIVVALVLGFRRFDGTMPLVRNCTAAISAACHPLEDDKDASSKAVIWGEVVPRSTESDGAESDNAEDTFLRDDSIDQSEHMPLVYRHCSFTSREVVTPCADRLYA